MDRAGNEEEANEARGNDMEVENGVRLLHDLEHWIRSRALENNLEGGDDNHPYRESQSRIDAERAYQENIHESVFGKDPECTRKRKLEQYDDALVNLLVAGGKEIKDVPLRPLMVACDTIYVMTGSQLGQTKSSSDCTRDIDLQQFEGDAVQEFLDVLLGKKEMEEMEEDLIVPCCRISHFLQCATMMEQLEEILVDAVDAKNCLSFCQLADQLDIPSLFEASVSCMMSSLDDIKDHDMWDDFPRNLQDRVITLRNAVHSSIMSRGQRSKVCFTSTDEFLAIFSDHVRDQKERLREAKLRQQEIIDGRLLQGGRHRDIMGGSVQDAKVKIERQERRIRTLELFYQEQKKIFGQASKSNEKTPDAPFVLG